MKGVLALNGASAPVSTDTRPAGRSRRRRGRGTAQRVFRSFRKRDRRPSGRRS
jgi:hypothetical protein